MIWLIASSFIWAFSFGLIRGQIVGMDSFVLGAIRTLFALGIFLPFLRFQTLSRREAFGLFFAGFMQLGLMYGPYLYAFKLLQAHEVAIFTMTTPLFMVGLDLLRARRFSIGYLGCALLAVVGGIIVAWKSLATPDMLVGIVLVQVSNLFFAIGTLIFTSSAPKEIRSQLHCTAIYFAGALPASLILWSVFGTSPRSYSIHEWGVFAWLGIMATGLGFFLWNLGASRTRPGLLAITNNVKLPIAIIVSIFFFGERNVDYVRVTTGCLILGLAGMWVKNIDPVKT